MGYRPSFCPTELTINLTIGIRIQALCEYNLPGITGRDGTTDRIGKQVGPKVSGFLNLFALREKLPPCGEIGPAITKNRPAVR